MVLGQLPPPGKLLPSLNPTQGSIFLEGNCPDTIFNTASLRTFLIVLYCKFLIYPQTFLGILVMVPSQVQ